jgi:hypothetical protein
MQSCLQHDVRNKSAERDWGHSILLSKTHRAPDFFLHLRTPAYPARKLLAHHLRLMLDNLHRQLQESASHVSTSTTAQHATLASMDLRA